MDGDLQRLYNQLTWAWIRRIMNIIEQYPHSVAIAGAVIIIVENVLPHLPIKANSTVQVIINLAKMILGKKGQ